MFHIKDKNSYIKVLQRMLSLPETGVINDRMRERIKFIQVNEGYAKTGVVDYETHSLIVEQSLSIPIATASQKRFPYKLGDFSEDIIVINQNISLALAKYRYFEALPIGRGISSDTIKAAERLSEIFGTEFNGEISKELYDRILCEIFIGQDMLNI